MASGTARAHDGATGKAKVAPDRPPRKTGVLRNRPLLTLMLGHLTVDMYVGILPVIYPLLIGKFDLSLQTVGLVAFAYSGMASIMQPLFGWIVDKYGSRFIGLALAWTGIMFCLIGFAPSFPILVLIAALAGIGSGAYHPMGAVNARAVIADKDRNTGMSLYVSAGTLGVALGPLVGAIFLSLFGLNGTIVTILPGVGIAIWMLFEMRTISARMPQRDRSVAMVYPPVPMAAMSAVIGLMMLRAWTMFGIQSFIPSWYDSLGYSRGFYSLLATTILLTSALGTIGSGTLADRHGRKAVLIGSTIASVPAILLFAEFPGRMAFVWAALIGLLAASTGPLLLVIAQELMAKRAGMASGMILGLGFVMGSVGVPVMGAVADRWGMQNAMRMQVGVAMLTIVLAAVLPNERRISDLVKRNAAMG